MRKTPISITLAPENLLWVRARAAGAGGASVSAEIDRLIAAARAAGAGGGLPVRSVVGTVTIAGDDPDLLQADAAVRALFTASLVGEGTVAEPAGSTSARHRRARSTRERTGKTPCLRPRRR